MTKKFFAPIVAICFTVIGCNSDHLSESEDKGIKDILANFGGKCEYSIGYNIEGSKSRKYFELRLSESRYQKAFDSIPEVPSSNIAFTFFKHLIPNETVRYDFIRSKILLISGKEFSKDFESKKLLLVDSKMHELENTLDLLKSKKYSELERNLNNSVIPYNKRELMTEFERIDSIYGGVEDFSFLGFRFYKFSANTELLHISASVKQLRAVLNFSIDLNPYNNDIYLIRYEL
jgi:hypothetical protein